MADQAIMCAGDMTLEKMRTPNKIQVDGWGVTHQCRDWDAMYDFMAPNRGDHWESGII